MVVFDPLYLLAGQRATECLAECHISSIFTLILINRGIVSQTDISLCDYNDRNFKGFLVERTIY